MTPDISTLNAAELEQLIRAAAERRAQLQPQIQPDAPKKFAATVGPYWYTFRRGEYTVLQLRDPGLGWLAYALPAPTRGQLLRALLEQQLMVPADAPQEQHQP